MSTKAHTAAGMVAILTATLLWVGFARFTGPSASIPGWLNPPAEPAR